MGQGLVESRSCAAQTVGRGRPDRQRCSRCGFLGVMTNKTEGQDSRARRTGRWSNRVTRTHVVGMACRGRSVQQT